MAHCVLALCANPKAITPEAIAAHTGLSVEMVVVRMNHPRFRQFFSDHAQALASMALPAAVRVTTEIMHDERTRPDLKLQAVGKLTGTYQVLQRNSPGHEELDSKERLGGVLEALDELRRTKGKVRAVEARVRMVEVESDG